MPGYVVCACCGGKVPATAADIGRAVVCPTSRRLVLVRPGDLVEDAGPTDRPRRRGRRLAAAVAILILAGAAGYVGWNATNGPPADGVAAAPPAADGETPATPPRRPDLDTLPPPDAAASGPAATTPPPATSDAPVLPDRASPPRVAAAPAAPGGTTPTPVALVQSPEVGPPGVVAAPSGPTVRVAKDARGIAVHRLAKRIDRRTAEELQRDLLGVREVALDTPAAPQTSQTLFAVGVARRAAGLPYPGPALAAKGRDDLACLPFRFGPDTVLFKTQAEALDAYSRRLRDEVQRCIPGGRTDPRPDPDKLYAALRAGSPDGFRDRRWAVPEAVPCVCQMLQAEGAEVRRVGVELLRNIPTPAATEALARWAAFEIDPDVRAAAVDALAGRDRAAVTAHLLGHLRFPWPRAAEHAAEALVALDCRAAVPDLAALLAVPDPDAPRPSGLPDRADLFRRELVRVNHARNCLMCHAPSPAEADLVRAAMPDPARPLPPPTTPGYYRGGGQFVTAGTTYLRQDFSVVQPVPSPGVWPEQQRYDYLVAVRPAREAGPGDPGAASPYRHAVLFALRELTGRDLGTAGADWDGLRAGRTAPDDRLAPDAGRYFSLRSNPEALTLFYLQEFGTSFLALTPAERVVVLARFRKVYGPAAARLAVVAYLEGLTRSADAATRTAAAAALAVVRGQPDDGGAPDPAVADRLLANPDPRVRAAAAGALGGLGAGAKAHVRTLMKALTDADADVRAAAATALGELPTGPDEMFDALAAATQDAASRVRQAAAAALQRLKILPRSSARPLAEGLVKAGEWASAGEREAFEAACAALLDDMRGRAGGSWPVLVKAAAGGTPTAVLPATLAKLLLAAGPPPKDQLAALVPLLARPAYRAAADTQLHAAGDDAVPVLIAALRDESAKTRVAAAEVLGRAAALNRETPPARASWRAALDALATAKSSDSSADVRAAAAAALARLSAGQ